MNKFSPIYKRIADDLMARISSGEFPVGSKLPTEHELKAALSVSRATVISAFNYLESVGLIDRRPRTGTRVISQYPMRSEIEGLIKDDWANFDVGYQLVIDRKGLADLPAEFTDEGMVPTGGWLHLVAHREDVESRATLCSVDHYIHPDYSDVIDDIVERPPRVYSLIEARHGPLIRVVDQVLTVGLVDLGVSSRISLMPGQPVIKIVRCFRGEKEKIIQITVDMHPGNTFSYKTRTFRDAQ